MTRSLFVIATLLALAGCGTPGVQVSGTAVSVEQGPVAGAGHVLLKMQSARPSTIFNPKWQMLRVAREGAMPVELNDISGAQSTGALFYARLPAGSYRVTEVQSVGPGPGLLLAILAGDLVDLRVRELRFTVREGELSNLGTVVDSAPLDKDPKTHRVVLLRDALGQAAAAEALEARTGQKLTSRQNGGWANEATPQEAQRALVRARALMSVLSPGDDALDAVVIGGTALGQILLRDAKGEWQSEALDTLAAVTYARRLADGTLLAGTEHGRIYERRPHGAWRQLRLADGASSVLHIEPLGDAWLVTAQKGYDVAVYRLDAAGVQSAPIASINTGGGLYAGTLANAEQLVLTRNTPAFARESQHTIIEKRSLQSTTREEKYLVFAYQRLRSGEVFMDRFTGMTHYVSYSRDGGRSWQHVQTEAPLWPHFIDAQRGYALDLNRGMFSVDSILVRTQDGGKSWTRTGVPVTVETAGRVLGIAADNAIVASLGWEVRSSRDEGKTWRRELPRLID